MVLWNINIPTELKLAKVIPTFRSGLFRPTYTYLPEKWDSPNDEGHLKSVY